MDSELLSRLVGERIRLRRKALGKKQKDVAAEMGISRAALANIETGRQNILLHHMYRFADVLDLAVPDLLPDSAELQRPAKITDLPLPENLSREQRGQIARLLGAQIGDALPKEGKDNALEKITRPRAQGRRDA